MTIQKLDAKGVAACLENLWVRVRLNVLVVTAGGQIFLILLQEILNFCPGPSIQN